MRPQMQALVWAARRKRTVYEYTAERNNESGPGPLPIFLGGEGRC